MTRSSLALALLLGAPAAIYGQKPARQAEVKIQKTSLTRDQEIQLGKDAAAQVEREKEVVENPEVERWLNQIGQNLGKAPQANAYPYYFKLVNDDSINAFALPGGPMYVHTGLLKAAGSEGEVAGVLAHEMSHVALRHGAAQIGKQNTWGTLFGAIGAAVGTITTGPDGDCGMLCQLGALGTGIGGSTVLMKFSRGYEHDADLNGARMMASSGYDPIQLPRFFEKLEATAGTAAEPKGLALWMSSHPATGSRVQYVSEDIQFYPKRTYTAGAGGFSRVKQIVAAIPPAKPKPAALLLAKQGGTARANLPGGLKDYQANGFAIGYPGAWQPTQAAGGGSLYLAPQGGLQKGHDGDQELILGGMVDYFVTDSGADLDAATNGFLGLLRKRDANLRAEASERAQVGGKPALRTRLTTKSSFEQDPDQTIFLYTVSRDAGLWFVLLAAPTSRLDDYGPVFQQIVATVEFPN